MSHSGSGRTGSALMNWSLSTRHSSQEARASERCAGDRDVHARWTTWCARDRSRSVIGRCPPEVRVPGSKHAELVSLWISHHDMVRAAILGDLTEKSRARGGETLDCRGDLRPSGLPWAESAAAHPQIQVNAVLHDFGFRDPQERNAGPHSVGVLDVGNVIPLLARDSGIREPFGPARETVRGPGLHISQR